MVQGTIWHLTTGQGFLKSFQKASAEIPFSAKHTESHFTRGELEICWRRKGSQSPLCHTQKLEKQIAPFSLPPETFRNCPSPQSDPLEPLPSQRLKQRGQTLTAEEPSHAKDGLPLQNTGFPSDHSGCSQPEVKIWFSRLLRAKVQMISFISTSLDCVCM